jgi:hypothetical protein
MRGANGFAIASLICGIASLCAGLVTAILALIFGHIALTQINQSGGMEQGRGIAIAGLVMDYVFLALGVLYLASLIGLTEQGRESPQLQSGDASPHHGLTDSCSSEYAVCQRGGGAGMPCKQTTTPCGVRLLPLRGLSLATLIQCQELRLEAGRLWTALVSVHAQARAQGRWLSAGELEEATKGGQEALHR